MAKKEKIDALVPVEEQPYPVPENWRWVRLGAAYTISPKVIADDNAIAAFVPMEKISPGFEDFFTFEEQPWHKAKKGHTQFADGDVAFAKISPCFENHKSMTINGLPNGIGGGTTELIILRQPNINQKFTYWIINTEEFIKGGCATYSGTVGQQRISMDYVRNYPVPLPPFPEQQRIVDRIESLFAKLDEAKEKAQAVVDGFEDRKAAILHKAFIGELTRNWRGRHNNPDASIYLNKLIENDQCFSRKEFKFWNNKALPEGWVESKIGNLLYFAGRIGWKGLKAEEYTESGPMLLSVYNLNDGDEVTYNRVYHISDERYQESPEIMVQEGDVLLTKDGAGIGKLGYVKELPQEATINSSLLLIRPGYAAVSKFIYYILLGPNLQRIAKERITGSATPHLFQRDIKDFVIPVPSLEEQEEIVLRLDRMLQREQQAIAEAKELVSQVDNIKKSILAKAFRSELGTNDPTEPPVEIA